MQPTGLMFVTSKLDQPIWLLWDDTDISPIHGLIADNRYFQNLKITFSGSLSKI